MLNLYTKAALCAFKPEVPTIKLPQEQLVNQFQQDQSLLSQYNEITGWNVEATASLIHPLYIQVLSLPVQLQMMVDKKFPFKPIGLVHLANKVTLFRLPTSTMSFDVVCYFGEVFRHKRGIVFEVITEAVAKGKTLVKASSYYLSRHSPDVTRQYSQLVTFNENEFMRPLFNCQSQVAPQKIGEFSFGHDLGRKYAKISGDYNPIHLWPLTANLFGFKQAIAHGMFTKAVVVSELFKQNSNVLTLIQREQKVELKAVFKAPIMLPNQCELQMMSAGDSISLQLCTKTKKRDRAHIFVNCSNQP